MPREEVIIIVDEEGAAEIEVNGVKGTKCKDLTKDLEAALGTGGTSTAKKEIHEQPRKEQLRNKA